MKNSVVIYAVIAATILLAASALGQQGNVPGATITYISSEGVYFDAGTVACITLGDSLRVVRNQDTVAIIVVTNVSTKSSAGIVAVSHGRIEVGDSVIISPVTPDDIDSNSVVLQEIIRPYERRRPARNLVEVDIALQNFWHRDMSGSGFSWTQPGLRTRLRVQNVAGTGAVLRMRHRTRLYHRARTIRVDQSRNEWVQQLYEFSLGIKDGDRRVEWAIGRTSVPYVPGVGFVDGGYIVYHVRPRFRVGVAGGTAPDNETSAVSLEQRKVGLFAAFETGSYSTQRLFLSAALSTLYERGTVSRDFIFLQGTYSRYKSVTISQSAEIDLNRHWRHLMASNRFSFTGYHANARVTLSSALSASFSYDTRKRIRYFESMTVPDSLFDDDSHGGIKGGVTMSLMDRLLLRGSIGIRFRNGGVRNNRVAFLSMRLKEFPAKRHSLTANFSVIETQFTIGYRPIVRYRFPVARKLMTNVSAAGYIYKTGSSTTGNYYIDVSTSYYFANGYYLSGSFRQNLDKYIRSSELFTEFGMSF